MLSRRSFLAALAGIALAPRAVLAALKRVDLICRPAWRARKPRREDFATHRVRRLTVHHSAVKLTDNREAPARFRSHQASHMAKGWPDIAYHVLVDRGGNVYRGRSWRFKGDTATNYDPAGHFLVMCEGNFEDQRPSGAQLAALADVLAWASERFGVKPGRIGGHRDYASTSCPGRHLHEHVDSGKLRRMVRRRLRSGGVKLAGLCGSEGKQRVADIEAGLA
jgi:N-acetyl-anhydromuramyl-L-alanine amidase AmpD